MPEFPPPEVHSITTYYATSEVVTGWEGEWENYVPFQLCKRASNEVPEKDDDA